jgi:hypothetical protein
MANGTLKLNGKPLSFASKRPSLERLISFLEKLPSDEVLSAPEILKRNICGRDLLMRAARDNERIAPYRFLMPIGTGLGFYVFGSPKAIAAVRKQAEKELGDK